MPIQVVLGLTQVVLGLFQVEVRGVLATEGQLACVKFLHHRSLDFICTGNLLSISFLPSTKISRHLLKCREV